MEVRDPIHGAIALSPAETTVVDDPWIQRLRSIRQTGFSQMAFPGATHTRYVHSLGVMHMAGLAFDSALQGWSFDHPTARDRLRRCVRIAALCHDLGHAPFSHCMEFSMPAVGTLPISWLEVDATRTASHEDYTIAILESSSLRQTIEANHDFTARHVASLIRPEIHPGDDFFVDGGLDHRRLLSQIVSSELDVDRLDYLPRDASATGVRYGQVDTNWLLANLATWVADGRVNLALEGRAVYAFDHFLLARHHMFLMVYFHHKSVIYEELLRRYIDSEGCPWQLPSDLDEYLHTDDVAVVAHLRASDDPWARRVAEYRPFRRVLERHGTARSADLTTEAELLREAGLDVVAAASTGRLSRYAQIGAKRRSAPEIYVLERTPGLPVERVRPLSEASEVFTRYAEERVITRLYVPPDEAEVARSLLG
ncbi:MAG: HD domain-containing protein [Myxococcales bacterium]|nr:HD domain-containing protein [Myxococcales bacterium]